MQNKMKNKNGVDYYYIVAKILLELKTLTPQEVELLFEKLDDFSLLSDDGKKVRRILYGHVWDIDYDKDLEEELEDEK
jgi:hypothetical protein